MDNDQNIQLSEFKKDFKELFYDNNLNLLANPSDLGFTDEPQQDEQSNNFNNMYNQNSQNDQEPLFGNGIQDIESQFDYHTPIVQRRKGPPIRYRKQPYNGMGYMQQRQDRKSFQDFDIPFQNNLMNQDENTLSAYWAKQEPKQHFNNQYKPFHEPYEDNKGHISYGNFIKKEYSQPQKHQELVPQNAQQKIKQQVVFNDQQLPLKQPVQDNKNSAIQKQTLNQSTRSIRGLRVLSLKVRDIVYQEKRLTYKDVAERLIKQISETTQTAFKGKEEQNVKRRVYDALNVLIAANVLRKNGKTVYCEDSIDVPKDAKQRIYNKQEKLKLANQIKQKQRHLNYQKQTLQELIFKSIAIKNLIKRNREQEELKRKKGENLLTNLQIKVDNNKENRRCLIDNQQKQKIDFPFVVLFNKDKNNDISVQVNQERTSYQIESQKKLRIFGELDVLLVLKHHLVDKKDLPNYIDKNLIKYLPENYPADFKKNKINNFNVKNQN